MSERRPSHQPGGMDLICSHDHGGLARIEGYAELRMALTEFIGNTCGEVPLADLLTALRAMAVTTVFADFCPAMCSWDSRWPHAVRREGDHVTCTYRCPAGDHTWTRTYAIGTSGPW